MKKVIEILKQIRDEADLLIGPDTRSFLLLQRRCELISASTKRLVDEALKLIPTTNHCCCKKCGANLWQKEAVTRTYISKDTSNPDSHARGHYDRASGDYSQDRSPDYPLVSHDLVDGSDTCSVCGAVVG
jgi:hypothetical protein